VIPSAKGLIVIVNGAPVGVDTSLGIVITLVAKKLLGGVAII
jgi:hypothetical protein